MNVAVFCGSSPGLDQAHVREARALGKLLAARGHRLVYGGGRVGLMGALADAALEGGAEVVGVIPRFIEAREVAHTSLTELVVVESMHERKAKVSELADGFLVLGGGFGTLDELFEILSWKQLGLHDRPIVVANVGGAWDALERLLRDVVRSGFARPAHLELVAFASTAESALDGLEHAPKLSGSVASKLG